MRRDLRSDPLAAWRHRPSWYAIATQDRTTSPDLQRFLAERMNAHVVELETGHLPMVSRPDLVADLILRAAGAR